VIANSCGTVRNGVAEAPSRLDQVNAEFPANTTDEMDKKRALYFERGAAEVWLCSWDGNMTFYGTEGKLKNSEFCPTFPDTIVL